MDLFIYYRVPEADADAVTAAVRAAQMQMVLRWPTVQPACFVKKDGKGITVMESYAGLHGDAQAAMSTSIEAAMRSALAPWCIGERRIERFKRIG